SLLRCAYSSHTRLCPLSLHDALPILAMKSGASAVRLLRTSANIRPVYKLVDTCAAEFESYTPYLYSTYEEEDEAPPTTKKKVLIDRKSTRLNSSHQIISYAVFCLKKK